MYTVLDYGVFLLLFFLLFFYYPKICYESLKSWKVWSFVLNTLSEIQVSDLHLFYFHRVNYIKFLEPYSKQRRAHRHGHNMQAVMKHPQAELVIGSWLIS